MHHGLSKVALRHLGTLFGVGSVTGLTDAQLLERFVDRGGDEAAEYAFATLVERHGPMVLGVCRRVLRNEHDAEEAFQATFLVLVRKARRLARREALGPWLYGVARHAAQQARARAVRRQAKERQVIAMPRAEPTREEAGPDLRSVLDEELSRLPERYRAPVVLCELEGRSRKDAAVLLGVPEGTISSRLARARSLLRERLARRGLALSAGAMAAVLGRDAAAAAVPATLANKTVETAMRFAVGSMAAGVVPTSVATLTEGVLKVMFVAKLKSVLVVGLFLVAATGVGVLAQPAPENANDGPPTAARSPAQPAPENANVGPATGTDRLQMVEQKLDRILRALEPGGGGLPPAGPPSGYPGMTPYPVPPGDSPKDAANYAPRSAGMMPGPQPKGMMGPGPGAMMPGGMSSMYGAMAKTQRRPARNRAVITEAEPIWREHVERRLEHLEKRLDELAARLNTQGRGVDVRYQHQPPSVLPYRVEEVAKPEEVEKTEGGNKTPPGQNAQTVR